MRELVDTQTVFLIEQFQAADENRRDRPAVGIPVVIEDDENLFQHVSSEMTPAVPLSSITTAMLVF